MVDKPRYIKTKASAIKEIDWNVTLLLNNNYPVDTCPVIERL